MSEPRTYVARAPGGMVRMLFVEEDERGTVIEVKATLLLTFASAARLRNDLIHVCKSLMEKPDAEPSM